VSNVRTAGRSFAIATPHRLATDAGAEAFRKGGNAIDAAVAAAAALTVVYPHNCTIGGDIIALVHTPQGGAVTVNGSGAAASAASASDLREAHAEMPLTGPAPVTVPGAVAAWETLLSLGGRRRLADALESAIAYADEGVAVSRSLASAIGELQRELAADAGLREVFLADGAPLPEGAPLCQPALARTLRAIAAEGPSVLYGGEVGASLVKRVRSLGSRLTLDDLALHETALAEPIVGRFNGLEVLTAPPNSQGFVLLEILAALEALGGGSARFNGDDAGILARIFARTAGDRDRYLADPDFADVPLDELLSAAHVGDLVRDASSGAALNSPPTPLAGSGDTVAVVAADADGYAVSLIQSIFSTFGAQVFDPVTGILLQNRGASFSLDESSPNALVGGKRPAHTLMPVVLRSAGRVVGVNGTMGGLAQAQIHAHLLLAARSGASPAEAVRSPRWIAGTLDGGSTIAVVAEGDVPEPALAAIEAAGFAVEKVPALSEDLGHAQAIRIDGGDFFAGSDPRADGSAVVL
jgi:gamma-glutamyltranspeptidase